MSRVIKSCSKLARDIQSHSKPLRPFTVIQSHSESFRVIQGHSESFRVIQSHSEPFRAFQSHSELFKVDIAVDLSQLPNVHVKVRQYYDIHRYIHLDLEACSYFKVRKYTVHIFFNILVEAEG